MTALLALFGFGWAAAQGGPTLPPLFPIRHGDLHGLIDASGRVVLPPEFDDVKLGEPLVMVRKAARTAYFDGGGRMVVQPQEAWTQPFAEGLVPVAAKNAQGQWRWGYADPAGTMVIAPQFDSAGPFAGGLAVVAVADAWGAARYGAIDRSGKLVVPAVHGKLLAPAAGLVRSESKERTHRVFDVRGRDITPEKVDFVGIPSDGLVRVWSGRAQGFMTLAGEVRVAPAFEQASDFKEGRARVWIAGKYGYIDPQGKLVVPAVYEAAEDFSDGLALVKQGGKSLFIDPQGQVVLQPQADRAWSFSGGLAVVKVGTKHGYIDKRGQTVIEPQFSFARPFHNGLAYVGSGRESGYIKVDGRFVWKSGG